MHWHCPDCILLKIAFFSKSSGNVFDIKLPLLKIDLLDPLTNENEIDWQTHALI